MDTATPRTDAMNSRHADEHNRDDVPIGHQYAEMRDHAQQLERETIASAERVARLEAALNKIASWEEGEVVDGSFDDPFSAEIARQALGSGK